MLKDIEKNMDVRKQKFANFTEKQCVKLFS